MPTTLPRTQVTHTPEVRRALEVAAKRWPGLKPGALLVHLIEEGARAIEEDDRDADRDRRERIRVLAAGKYAGTYPPGYLDELRAGWDE